jgi:hypothetical protein
MGLLVDPALNALKALISLGPSKEAASPEPPSVGHSGLPAADSKV